LFELFLGKNLLTLWDSGRVEWENVGESGKSFLVMFSGEFEYRLDEKGRLPLPPRFRMFFKDGLVVAQGIEKCLTVYTQAEWKKLADNISGSNLPASKLRTINRALFATAFTLMLDAQGRLSLPPTLRQYAGIGEDVVVAGVNNYLELWDKNAWEAEKQTSQAQAWQIIEGLERR
jgi:MraZ protein